MKNKHKRRSLVLQPFLNQKFKFESKLKSFACKRGGLDKGKEKEEKEKTKLSCNTLNYIG
jgi:hypothetical protein